VGRLQGYKGPRSNNSGRREWSQIRILHALKNAAPSGLRFNEIWEQINKSAEMAKIAKISTKTLSRNLRLLEKEGAVVKSKKIHYISKRGFQTLVYLRDARGYEDVICDPKAILIGQELDQKEDVPRGYSVFLRTEGLRTPLPEKAEQEVEKLTNDYLNQLKNLLTKNNSGYEIKVQATITDEKRSPFSAYSYEDSSKH